MAEAMAVALIRPEHAIGADLRENRLFIEKRCFSLIWVISGPSRPQKMDPARKFTLENVIGRS